MGPLFEWLPRRVHATVVNLVVCLVVAYPAVEAIGERRWDSFPLSWYPMFSMSRGRHETVRFVMVSGGRQPILRLPFTFWTAGGFNQGSMQLKAAEREGAESLRRLCEQVAARVARNNELEGYTRVAVVRAKVDPRDYFEGGNQRLVDPSQITRCPVLRP